MADTPSPPHDIDENAPVLRVTRSASNSGADEAGRFEAFLHDLTCLARRHNVVVEAASFGEGAKAKPGLVLRTLAGPGRANAYYLSEGRVVFGRKLPAGLAFFERILGKAGRAKG